MGQEKSLAKMAELKSQKEGSGIWSILLSDSLKGYCFVEGEGLIPVEKTMSEVRSITGRALQGREVPMEEIQDLIVPKSPIADLEPGTTVRIIDGPFKDLRARITRMDSESEITVELLDSNMKLPVKIHADYVKKVGEE